MSGQGLAPGLAAYLAGGSESETALRRNRQALDRLALLPRVMRDVSRVDGSTRFIGRELAWPLLLAPVGSLHLLHAHGVAGVQQAAAGAGIACAVGSALPEARSVVAGDGLAIYQLYVEGDQDWLRAECRAARERGFAAVALTIDAPVFPERRRDIDTGNHAAGRQARGTSVFRKSLTWDRLAALIDAEPDTPILLKGVQDPRDADLACRAGVTAVYLSNHGGRQFDQGPGIASLIRETAAAIDGRAALIVDGGFASGNDVLKALALGADLVGLGRAYLQPYAEGGPAALAGFLAGLARELHTNMTLLGCTGLADLRDITVLDTPALP